MHLTIYGLLILGVFYELIEECGDPIIFEFHNRNFITE